MTGGRIIWGLLLTAVLLAAAGCAMVADPVEPDNGLSSPEDTDNGVSGDSGGETGSSADEEGEGMPEFTDSSGPLAYFGRTMDEIRAELGEPDDRGFFEGAEYFSYSDRELFLFFWANPDEDILVRSIHLSMGAEVAGIRVGMNFDEIKAVLGEPVFEGYSDYEENYALICDYNQFRFFFSADTADGPTNSVRIKYIIDS